MKLFSKNILIALTCFGFSFSLIAQEAIDEIIVRGEFRDSSLLETANSIAVITSEEIANRNANALAEVLSTAANVNFSSGASRGRFFQIRGIGERSQFVDPINPGVGLLIDGVDFSNLGGAATLFDVDQVEVLRGPQGTVFGTNALAGVINVQTNEATEDFDVKLKAGLGGVSGNRGTLDSSEIGLVLNGALASNLNGRIAVQQVTSDGFVENTFLDRDDTQNIDEQTIRGKLAWQASEDLDIDFNLILLDIDNGYDSFNLDNLRETITDEPGTDALDTTAFSVQADYQLDNDLNLEVALSNALSDSEYSFDEDWTNPNICAGQPCAGFEYTSFDEYLRDIRTSTADVRLLSANSSDQSNWVLGLYLRDESTDLVRNNTFLPETFISDYEQTNVALYGEYDLPLTQNIAFSAGLRLENFDADYRDNAGQDINTDEVLAGGHISLESTINDNYFAYARISRGYKSGGVNVAQGDDIPLEYDTETLWNYELGIKGSPTENITGQLNFFYQDRNDAQVRQSQVTCPDGGGACSFDDFIDNAAEASGYGLEADIIWSVSQKLSLGANLGLLQTEFDDYLSFSHVNAVPAETDVNDVVIQEARPFDLSGEEIAQSPEYQLTLSANITLTDAIDVWVAFEAKDEFRFSNRHSVESESYELINARVTWAVLDNTKLSFWGRNLTNEDTTTRGFGSFPNDPRDLFTTFGPYVQFGEPREVGVTLEYDL